MDDMASGTALRGRHTTKTTTWTTLLGPLLVGILLGAWWSPLGGTALPMTTTATGKETQHRTSDPPPPPRRSTVTRLGMYPPQHTSHAGAVTKQVLLPSFTVAPNVATLSVATVPPGAGIAAHMHPTMHEIFFVLSGRGSVTLKPSDVSSSEPTTMPPHTLTEGAFLYTAPGDTHAFAVASAEVEPLRMIYFGVTTE